MRLTGSSLLKDKVIIMSGVGAGLGVCAAEALAREGAAVVCVARTSDYVEEVVDDIRKAGGEAIAAPGDISSREDCDRIAYLVERTYGGLNGLVNSAYTAGKISPFSSCDLDEWRNVMNTNFFGALSLIQATLPLFEKSGSGAIININTTSSIRPMVGQGAYGSSRCALEFATRLLALELGPQNIRMNTMYCGPMIGPALNSAMEKWATQRQVTQAEITAQLAANFALGRVPDSAEPANMLVVLLSDYCTVLTGAAIHATGGAWIGQRV
jgi:NAD(P)-dependent dehydrogenase (short-subunit alcohol dehydrogenase family)